MRECNFEKSSGKCNTHSRGPSSYDMYDSEQLLSEFNLKSGDTVLDLGCGRGDYSLACARFVGDAGCVYALEKQSELLDDLNKRAKAAGINNIKTRSCDISKSLTLEDDCIDVCIIITVLHHPNVSPHKSELFAEIKRVLKSGGRLITIDVKKEGDACGPPSYMRLSPEEINNVAEKTGLKKINEADLGHSFLLQFKKS